MAYTYAPIFYNIDTYGEIRVAYIQSLKWKSLAGKLFSRHMAMYRSIKVINWIDYLVANTTYCYHNGITTFPKSQKENNISDK